MHNILAPSMGPPRGSRACMPPSLPSPPKKMFEIQLLEGENFENFTRYNSSEWPRIIYVATSAVNRQYIQQQLQTIDDMIQ